MAVISSGSTGSCIIFLVNVMASVSVICITGNSGPATGTAAGGASGSALVLAASTPSGNAGPAGAQSGSAGYGTALVTSGNTGDCAMSITNTFGSVSMLCRTGNSGPAQGSATGGDSGSAVVMLKAPSTPALAPVVDASPFAAVARAQQFVAGAQAAPQSWNAPGGSPFVAPATTARLLRSDAQAGSGPQPDRGEQNSAVLLAQASFLPPHGLGVPVPLSFAAGMLLAGGLGASVVSRRRRIRRD